MNIEHLINEHNIFFLEEQHKADVLNTLTTQAIARGYVTNESEFKAAIKFREALCSTAIGDGVAIPHAKISTINEFFVLTAILKEPVEWDAPDQKPVRLVFLIGGPDNGQNDYLNMLGKILKVVKNPANKDLILGSNNTIDVAKVFSGVYNSVLVKS